MLNRILSFYTKYLAVWVILSLIIAYFWPGPFVVFKPILPWFFALTMFGIGAVLQVKDFKRIIESPVVVVIGCTAQFIIMPFGAFFLSRIFRLNPTLTAGLILAGSAPGAMASNVLTYIAKADTAYSVSLTTVSTLLCPILTPALTLFLAGSALNMSFWNMFLNIIITVILPLILGFGLRHYCPKTVEKALTVFPAISVTFIVFICALVIALNQQRLKELTAVIFIVVFILNIYGYFMGYTVGKFFRMAVNRCRTLSIEIGMQNAGLGAMLAITQLGDKAAIPSATFIIISIVTISFLVEFWQRKTISTIQ
jgi:BASS family bile acid:Na+ symporter